MIDIDHVECLQTITRGLYSKASEISCKNVGDLNWENEMYNSIHILK